MYNYNFEASKLSFKWDNENSRNEIGVIHLHNHYLSDTFRLRRELSLKFITFVSEIYSL